MERWKIFHSKRWMTHVCMTWYDVWNTLCMIFSFALFLKTNLNWLLFHCYFEFMNHSTLKLFTFPNHFFGLISLLRNPFFNHFFWNTISMTCMKLPRAWKGLDEPNLNWSLAQNVFGLSLIIKIEKWRGLHKLPLMWSQTSM